MANEAKIKRPAGQLAKDGRWLVLAESTGKQGVGFTHECGTQISGKSVTSTVRDGFLPLSGGGDVETKQIPYCPNCEQEPPSAAW